MVTRVYGAAGLSVRELGDLLGIHPHYLHSATERFDSLPISVLIDLAHRLDMRPVDLVPALASVLGNKRRPPGHRSCVRRSPSWLDMSPARQEPGEHGDEAISGCAKHS